MGEGPFGLPGVGRVQGDLDAAHRGFDPGADLEQLQPQGSAGGGRKLGVRQADPAEGAEQDVGQGREPEAQLIGAHAAGGGAVGKEIELALLDAVFARSAAPSSSPPAFDVTSPPSKAACTRCSSTDANSNSFGVHCVCIGDLLCRSITLCCKSIIAQTEPRCTRFV